MKSFKQYIIEKRTSFPVAEYDPVFGYMAGTEGEVDGLENPRTAAEIKQFMSRSRGGIKFIADKTDNTLYVWGGDALHGQVRMGLGIDPKHKMITGDVSRQREGWTFYLDRPFNKNADVLFSIKAAKPLEQMLEDMQENDGLILKEFGY